MKQIHVMTIAIALSAAGLLGWATRHGAGFYSDTEIYFSMARSFSQGLGFMSINSSNQWIPETFFPPFYPILLAMTGHFGGDLLQVVRRLNIVLFAATASLVARMIYERTQEALWPAFIGGLLTLSSIDLIQNHMMAWSEPPFIFFSAVLAYFLIEYLDEEKRWQLIGAGVFLSLAALTRYAGYAWCMAAPVILLAWPQGRCWSRRAQDVAFLLFPALPVVLWGYRNHRLGSSTGGRVFDFHPGALWNQRENISRTLSKWVCQDASAWHTPWTKAMALGVLILFAYGVVTVWLSRKQTTSSAEGRVIGVMVLCYLSLVVVTITCFDASTPLDERLLSPLHPLVLAWVVPFLYRSWPATRRLAFIPILISMAVTIGFAREGLRWATMDYAWELGYGAAAWKESSLIQWIRTIPKDVVIYSNAPYPIIVYLERGADLIPPINSLRINGHNPDYQKAMAQLQKRVTAKKAIIVYFNESEDEEEQEPTVHELRELIPLRVLKSAPDGTIYGGA